MNHHTLQISYRVEPVLFQFDFTLLQQAIYNIIHNAIEYTPKDSKIEVIYDQIGDRCILAIKDNGGGIPQDSLDKIFQKFFRGSGVKAGGTGLGLSIAKGFIEAHHGQIRAINNPDGGAIFQIIIPINR